MLDLLLTATLAGAAGYALAAIRHGRPTHRPPTEAQQRGAQAPSCTVCEGDPTFPSVAAAREHARDVHNAMDRESADWILSLPAEGR